MSDTQPLKVETASQARETPLRTLQARRRGWSTFLMVGLMLHIPLFIYPVLRLCGWLDLDWLATLAVFIPLVSSQILSRITLRRRRGWWVRWLRRAADAWLGISPVLLFILLVFEGIVMLTGLAPATAAAWVIGIACATGTYGVLNALTPTVVTISLTSSKIAQPLRFVQITDLHLGSRSRRFLEKVIFLVNRLDPDFVCITGDFVDASGISEAEMISLRSVTGPVYFSIGNHEKYEDLDAIVERLKNLGVHVLRNETLFDARGVQVIGIDDMDDAFQVERQLSKIPVDTGAYVLLMYHRPRGLEAAARQGVDLMISGHTHNGQIVPFNLVVNNVFEKACGLFQQGNTHLYVSQGTGTWGPVMRIGTRSEITLFEINPA